MPSMKRSVLLKSSIGSHIVPQTLLLGGIRSPHTSTESLACILQSIRRQRHTPTVLSLNAYVHRIGIEAHPPIGDCFVCVLAELGFTSYAHKVFERLPHPEEDSWNALIVNYVKADKPQSAIALFQKMQTDASEALLSLSATLSLIKVSSKIKDVTTGVRIHNMLSARTHLLRTNHFIGSALIDMYAKCGLLAKAAELFDTLPVRDVVSWTTMIGGYAEQGYGEEALMCLEQMQIEGVPLDTVSYISGMKACGCVRAAEKGMKLHTDVEIHGLLGKNYVFGSTMVDMYSKCGLLNEAQHVFDQLQTQDAVAWNSLISGYVEIGKGKEALECFEKMQSKDLSPTAVTFVCALKACNCIKSIKKGQELHVEIDRQGLLGRNVFVGSALVDVYAKCGLPRKAKEVFDKLTERNVVCWTTLIAGFVECGHDSEALKCFEQMQAEGVAANPLTFVCILKACGNVGDLAKGEAIYAEIARRGFHELDAFIGSSLVDLYSKCACLQGAQEIFDKLRVKDIVSWNALIGGFSEHGHGEKALRCLELMQLSGIVPDSVTLLYGLKACGNLQAIEKGKELHWEIKKQGLLETNILFGSALIDMYVKCGLLSEAQEVFDELTIQDVVVWNALISGYVELGCSKEALRRLEDMSLKGVCPDGGTFVCSLKACGSIGDTDKIQELHAEIERRDFIKELHVGNALMEAYANCDFLFMAEGVFSKLSFRDVVSWTTLISGYTEQGNGEKALQLFEQMQDEGISPNFVTFACSLRACSHTGAEDKGILIHEEISKHKMLETDPIMGNILVEMYANCGLLDSARQVFGVLPCRDIISWTSLIAGYIEEGNGKEALEVFQQMQHDGVHLDALAFIYILKACGISGSVDKGEEIHIEIERQGLLNRDIVVGNSLVDMYAKCGSLEKAQEVFTKLPVQDVVSRTALMAGYAQLGESSNVFGIFEKMIQEGIKPDPVSFVVLLNTCSREGLFNKSQTYIEAMSKDYAIVPTVEHQTCVVDLLSRVGKLDSAIEMISKGFPYDHNCEVWHAVLNACKNWGNLEIGKQAFDHSVSLDETDSAAYALMSHIYATQGHRVTDAC